MFIVKKFIHNNTYDDLYKHYEDMLSRRETRLLEMGLYPKNQEKLLEYSNNSDNFIDKGFSNILFFNKPEDYHLLCSFCDESDVLFLKNNLDINKRNILFKNIVNLKAEFIIERIKYIQLNWRDMRHRTYEGMYKIFQIKPSIHFYIRYTKPKNKKEEQFHKELLKTYKFTKKMFLLEKLQVLIIFNYFTKFQQL